MAISLQGCHVCGRRFEVKFSFQVKRGPEGVSYYCTQACQLKARMSERPAASRSASRTASTEVVCATCDTHFTPKYAFQRVTQGDAVQYFCSMDCRSPVVRRLEDRLNQARRGPRRIAILNQKGGTGKTTTTISLAAGLAARGKRVLVVDMDAQGHVGISLGAKTDKSLFHVMVEDLDPQKCAVTIRDNFDIIPSNETLASAEIYLARMNEGRDKILRTRMKNVGDYEYIILDCGPSLSLLNMNALTYAQSIIVPVACDFLSLVGVKQILKTLKNVNQYLLHPVDIMGILPTFYDRRNKISNEAVNTLKGYFKEKVLPPIRVNTRLKEAPSHKQTIYEYAPDSNGARDYARLVSWVMDQTQSRRNVA